MLTVSWGCYKETLCNQTRLLQVHKNSDLYSSIMFLYAYEIFAEMHVVNYTWFQQASALEDAISVDRIVKEFREEVYTNTLLYKPQGIRDPEFPNLAEDTSLFVIMTSFQASMFEAFCSKITCLDSTHKTNQCRFKLLTVVVPDEYHNGRSLNKFTRLPYACMCTFYFLIVYNYISTLGVCEPPEGQFISF